MNIIQTIITHKQTEVAHRLTIPYAEGGLKGIFDIVVSPPLLKGEFKGDFYQALRKKPSQTMPNLIAEIKKASPSKGRLLADGDIVQIAKTYEQAGASAVSILTDEKFFSGSIADVKQISTEISLPVLRKDFIFTKEQILEAKLAGASAVLLMITVIEIVCSPLDKGGMEGGFKGKNAGQYLQSLIEYAHSLGLDALVETHSEAEIEMAVAAGARIMGVNSRDFDDLSIDLSIFPRLLPLIPDNIVKVAESGIYTREDVLPFAHLCDAILVGSSLMEAGLGGIEGKISQLTISN